MSRTVKRWRRRRERSQRTQFCLRKVWGHAGLPGLQRNTWRFGAFASDMQQCWEKFHQVNEWTITGLFDRYFMVSLQDTDLTVRLQRPMCTSASATWYCTEFPSVCHMQVWLKCREQIPCICGFFSGPL